MLNISTENQFGYIKSLQTCRKLGLLDDKKSIWNEQKNIYRHRPIYERALIHLDLHLFEI